MEVILSQSLTDTHFHQRRAASAIRFAQQSSKILIL